MNTPVMSGWSIAQAYGMTLIGKHSVDQYGVARLGPVFELKPQMAMGQQGMQLAHIVLPVWLLGLNDVDIPHGSLVVPCEEFTREQQSRLKQAVELATGLQRDMRNEGARVAIASASALKDLKIRR